MLYHMYLVLYGHNNNDSFTNTYHYLAVCCNTSILSCMDPMNTNPWATFTIHSRPICCNTGTLSCIGTMIMIHSMTLTIIILYVVTPVSCPLWPQWTWFLHQHSAFRFCKKYISITFLTQIQFYHTWHRMYGIGVWYMRYDTWVWHERYDIWGMILGMT